MKARIEHRREHEHGFLDIHHCTWMMGWFLKGQSPSGYMVSVLMVFCLSFSPFYNGD